MVSLHFLFLKLLTTNLLPSPQFLSLQLPQNLMIWLCSFLQGKGDWRKVARRQVSCGMTNLIHLCGTSSFLQGHTYALKVHFSDGSCDTCWMKNIDMQADNSNHQDQVKELIQKTADSLDGLALKMLFVSVQQNNLELCIRCAIK